MISKANYDHIVATIKRLRGQIQCARMLLEEGKTEHALAILRAEDCDPLPEVW